MSEAEKRLKKKENLKRNILIASGLAGFICSLLIRFYAPEGQSYDYFVSNQSISTILALLLVLIWALVVPIICYFWHKSLDEQETHATRVGTFYAFYIYIIGAPTWWLLWRGEIAPEPSGMAIYFISMACFAVVSLWKKRFG